MNNNRPYKAWDINTHQFPYNKSISEQVSYLIKFAVLAPSSHNTQPWKYRVKENIIDIFPDLNRVLHYSDRTHRELFISIGCTLTNILVAAEHYKLAYEIEYFPENTLENIAVNIALKKDDYQSNNTDLFPYITERRTCRFPYLVKEVPDHILEELIKLNKYPDIHLHFITDKTIRMKLLDLIIETSLKVFADTVFREELSEWVRSVYTNKQDGMALFDMGFPGPTTIFASRLIKYIPARAQAELDRKMFKSAPVYMFIEAELDNKISWIKAGEIFELLALAATKHKLSLAPWAGLIEHDDAVPEVKKILQIEGRPIFYARMGYAPKQPHHSPRRGIEKVLI